MCSFDFMYFATLRGQHFAQRHTVDVEAQRQDTPPLTRRATVPHPLTKASLHKVTDTHVVDTPAHLNYPLTQPAPLSTFTLGYPQTPPSPRTL